MSDQPVEEDLFPGPRWAHIGGGVMSWTPPRPDFRWVSGGGRVALDPQGVYPRELPAPPRVVVWAAGDIADDVRAYAERREAEKSRYPS